ncbi:retrovirus-related Pol polyprotein from transposon 412 [Trichonephila clavipes]|nr:retrovirus-related Pol polyprotein from transposon 412 [Trichonephila clavipes]
MSKEVCRNLKGSAEGIGEDRARRTRYWALWDSLHLRNGVLYRKWDCDGGKTFGWQLILPKTRVSTVLKELHGSPTGGHFGVMQTLQKVCEHFYWNNVRSDLEKCCRTCDTCAARKGPRKRTRGRLQLYNKAELFERIAFDILSLIPRSSDGNKNILVVMDYFTKWPEAYPISDIEASAVVEVLVQHCISQFRVPLQLPFNQGRNFDSAVCKRLCEILAIDKTRTTALRPQSDVKECPSRDHRLFPSQMLFCRDHRLPADFLFSQPTDVPLAPEEYLEKLQAWGWRKYIIWLGKESTSLPRR